MDRARYVACVSSLWKLWLGAAVAGLVSAELIAERAMHCEEWTCRNLVVGKKLSFARCRKAVLAYLCSWGKKSSRW
jgi:hypothetical protein